MSVAANEAELMALEGRIAALMSAGDDETAAAWCQVAGEMAWLAHTGRMARPALDDAIEAMGLRHCPRGGRAPAAGRPDRVLHVMTEVAATGGHSRLAWRWIQRDVERIPTLALTCQRGPVPEGMAAAVAERGGTIATPGGGDLISRARELAALVDRHDLVVLHVHPSDVVSGLALADRRERPPVLLVNHADHCFWLGPRVPDLMVGTRAAASRLAERRRGVAPGRTAELPVPMDLAERRRERAHARAELGVPDGAVLMAVVAGDYKTRPVTGAGLLDVLVPAVLHIPEALVLAAGPDDAGAWAEASARTGGRIRALGLVEDVAALREAADLHLDSFPCSSQTSALEAAAVGVPVVSYRPRRPEAATYDLDDPALAGVHVSAGTPAEYAAALARLAGDAHGRRELGARTMEAVRVAHDPERWRALLDGVYERTRAAAGSGAAQAQPIEHTEADRAEDAFLLELHRATRLVDTVHDAAARSHDAFPADPAKGLSIVVHARDAADDILPLLRSAMATTAHLTRVEAIVVDDGSTDGTRELLRGLGGDLRAIRNPRPEGPHASFASGIRAASGPAVLLVTADIRLRPGWCQALSATLAQPGVSAASAVVADGGDPSSGTRPSAPPTSGRGVCLMASAAALEAGLELAAAHDPAARVVSERSVTSPVG